MLAAAPIARIFLATVGFSSSMQLDPEPVGVSSSMQLAPELSLNCLLHVPATRFSIDPSVPVLALVPKCGTMTMVNFMNSCSTGRVSDHQCLRADGGIEHRHTMPLGSHRSYAVIRHPVGRMVSNLNFRLDQSKPWRDWKRLGLPWGANITDVIDAMSDQDMFKFEYAFSDLKTWVGSANTAPVLCSIDEFVEYIQREYGFSGCGEIPISNPSLDHGEPRADQLERIGRVLQDDVELWQRHCNQSGVASLWNDMWID